EVRALCNLLGVSFVLRPAEAELDAGPRAIVEQISTVDLAIGFLVMGLSGTCAENPVERRAGEVRRIAIGEAHVGGRADAVHRVGRAGVEYVPLEHVLLRRLADAARIAELTGEHQPVARAIFGV